MIEEIHKAGIEHLKKVVGLRNRPAPECNGAETSIIDALSSEFHDDKSWKRKFRDSLEKQNKQIDKILEGLREEKEASKEEDVAIKSRLDTLNDTTALFRSGWVILAIIIAAVVGGFAEYLI